jgi:hypothetical protein
MNKNEEYEHVSEPYVLNVFKSEIKKKGLRNISELSKVINNIEWSFSDLSGICIVLAKYDQELKELYLENIIKETNELIDSFEKSTFDIVRDEQLNDRFYEKARLVLERKNEKEIKELLLVTESGLFTRGRYEMVLEGDSYEEFPGIVVLEHAVKEYVPKLNELGNLIEI